MCNNLLLVFVFLVFSVICVSSERSARFNLFDPASRPKTWKLIPRTTVVPAELRKSPLGVTPDDYFHFIPTYIGSVTTEKGLQWSGHCFQDVSASLKIDGQNKAVLSIKMENKSSLFCDDGYLIAYTGSFDITYFEIDGEKDITFNGPWTDDQYFDITTLGIRIFIFPDGITMTASEIYDTILLFFGGLIGAHVPEWTADENLQFLADHMNVTMPVRSTTFINISKSEVKSGDFLGVIRLDGLDPMLAWAMGSHTGHTCICLWVDNVLYVAESTVKSQYWPTDGIQMTPWDTWIQQAMAADYNVVHLPLSPANAAKFDANKAYAFFKTVAGLPYGFHNLFTGWIDTPEDNYPPPLNSHLVQLLAPFAEWLLQSEIKIGPTYDFITQGLNHRLKTSGLTLGQAYMKAYQQGISFTDLVTMPEQDSWTFNNSDGRIGPSMVCDVFVTEMWKAGGLFGSITNQIQSTEFTNWDAYSLNLFDSNYVVPAECKAVDPDLPFCQILGKYRMHLPDYNTVQPFPNMREKCPSEPPLYIKPANC
jgi:hypothetical protein